jgi:hypothetical protein
MYKFYVYYIISEKRLVILNEEKKDKDYHLFLKNNGDSRDELITNCNVFCIGFILGANRDVKPINKLEEFKK